MAFLRIVYVHDHACKLSGKTMAHRSKIRDGAALLTRPVCTEDEFIGSELRPIRMDREEEL